jgi:nicotinamidase-related amidase
MAARNQTAFFKWLDEWFAGLKSPELKRVVGDPACAAICSADIVNGFCYEGNLASPRVAAIVDPVVKLFREAHNLGVRNFVLVQDTHSDHASEFKTFPPHCIRGTREAETVDALRELPFADEFVIVRKNSLHPAIGTDLNRWLDNHEDLDTFVVVGDCTDLCTYQLAMHLKLWTDSRDLVRRVIVPANAVDTYDLPVAAAAKLGALPHDADVMHKIFLYHMALNGIQVVKEIV